MSNVIPFKSRTEIIGDMGHKLGKEFIKNHVHAAIEAYTEACKNPGMIRAIIAQALVFEGLKMMYEIPDLNHEFIDEAAEAVRKV